VTYLQQANLIVYCISSRTGLRRSDMRFLKIIQGMGLLENILFVNNCDLSEHDTLADLVASEQNTRQELSFLLDAPELYSFSALMRLFCAMEKKIEPAEPETPGPVAGRSGHDILVQRKR